MEAYVGLGVNEGIINRVPTVNDSLSGRRLEYDSVRSSG